MFKITENEGFQTRSCIIHIAIAIVGAVNQHLFISALESIIYSSTLAGVAQWIEHELRTKGSLVLFPVGAHPWVEGQVPRGGHVRGNHTLMFLSLSPSL